MGTLKTQMTNDLSIFFDTDDFADTVTYNGVSIPAIVDYGKRQDGRENDGQDRQTVMATIAVKVASVASPAYRDTVVIGSSTYRVMKPLPLRGDGYIWVLAIERDERPVV